MIIRQLIFFALFAHMTISFSMLIKKSEIRSIKHWFSEDQENYTAFLHDGSWIIATKNLNTKRIYCSFNYSSLAWQYGKATYLENYKLAHPGNFGNFKEWLNDYKA